MKEKAILATVQFDRQRSGWSLEDKAAELLSLCESAGLSALHNFTFRQRIPTASLLLGKGKVELLQKAVRTERAQVLVFDADLSPSQQRNIEEIADVKTIDRTQLILDIFAQRAKSSEGKLQVELAQLRYLLPRLSGQGIYLSRLGGGIGTRGPGEQKLEVDRRRIRERITKLSRQLQGLQQKRQSALARKREIEFPVVALVGYTNAGKSSLFNALTRSRMVVKDQLFSTLDTTTRGLALPDGQKVLLVDTVGFLSGLPHHLIESFKATLEETVEADLLLHVIDSSRSDWQVLERAVHEVLAQLGADPKPMIRVFNKIDVGRSYAAAKDAVFVSALTGQGLDALLGRIAVAFSARRQRRKLFVPNTSLGLTGFLYRAAHVVTRENTPEGAYFTVDITPQAEGVFKKGLTRGSLML